MKKTGLMFYVEGEYVTESDYDPHTNEPTEQNWTPFDNADLHPFNKPYFTIWSQFSKLIQKDREEIAGKLLVELIDWLRQERDWVLFDATLWLHRGSEDKPIKMFHWELC